MKISDPLGKVYTHTMFKKRSSYDMKSKDPKYAKQSSEISEDEEDLEEDMEMEHEDHNSEISDQSDDSLSTKSSKLAEQHQQRQHPSAHVQSSSSSHHLNHLHGSRREPRMSVSRGEERDREDAISFASRASRKSVNASQRRPTRATTANSSTRSRRSTVPQSSSKKYPPESGLGHTYNLWSSVNSLKRDHRRRFNRSLCGVLLGISIVLVILGILGIIGIAVYLGVVQKLDGDGRDLISVDGTFRVKSEEFSISLLNPDTNVYRLKAKKFSEAISNTYMKSNLKEAFVKTLIDGFASGSVRVFFKIILDKRYLPPSLQRDPVGHVKDILIQEIMTLSGGEFEKDDIDIDSILFDNSKLQETTQFYKPEPYQADEPEKPDKVETAEKTEKPEKPENKSLWQNLMERPNNKVVHLKDNSISADEFKDESNGFRSASARSDMEPKMNPSRLEDQFKPHLELSRGPTVYNPKMVPSIPMHSEVLHRPSLKFDPPLPSSPVPVQYSPSPVPNRLLSHSPTPSRRSGMMQHSTRGPIVTPIPNIQVRNPSVPTRAPTIMARHGTRFSTPRNNNRNGLVNNNNNNNHHPFQNRRHDDSGDDFDSELMSPFMEPPPIPQFGVLVNHNGPEAFIPSIPAPANHPSNILSNRSKLSATPASALIDRPSILITPKSDPPNSIPFRQDSDSKVKHQHFVVSSDLSNGPTLQTPQQMLREKIFGQGRKNENHDEDEDQLREPSDHFDNIWNLDMDSEELMMASESSNSDGKGNVVESLWTSLHKANYPHSMPVQTNSGPSTPRPRRLPLGNNGGQSLTGNALNMVDGVVLANQNTNTFKVGGSFAVTTKPQTAGKEIRVQDAPQYRDDPNIIHAKQVPSGTQLHQGPHGPMITSPHPTNYQVTQTPSAPQMAYQNNNEGSIHPQNNPMGRGVGGNVVQNSHNLPGPGNYNPPLEISPRPMQGDPGSGQQLIKNYLMEKALIAEQNQLAPQIFPQRNKLHFFNGSPTPNLLTPQFNEGTPRPGPSKKTGRPPHRPSRRPNGPSKDPLDAIPQALARLGQFDLSALSGIKRQDLAGSLIPAAAVGALTAGIGPLTVFSNLLNAYATMDSKHDITDKLVKSASQWLGVDENDTELTSKTTTRPTTQTEATTTEPTTTMSTTSSQLTSSVTKTSAQWTTTTTRSTTRVMEDWYGAPYQAVVVDSDDLPPVKSNVNPNQPLRKKPPSLGHFQATPKPNAYDDYDDKYKHTFNQNSVQYGVSNPNYVSDNLPPVTDNYGPTDFVVETVKLDKDFFHHFFTAKPMLLGTDFVTSTSVQVNHGRKRGRETTADEFSDYEASEAAKELQIQEMISQRIQSRLGEAATNPEEVMTSPSDLSSTTTTATTTTTITTTTTTTTTTTSTTTPQSTTFWTTTVTTDSTTTTSTTPSTTLPISRQSDTPIIVNNVHKFMRYQIPPEVKITHDLSVPKFATSEKTPVTSLHEIGGPRYNRFGKAGPQAAGMSPKDNFEVKE